MNNRIIKFRAWDGDKMNTHFVVGRPQAVDLLSIMTDEKFAQETYLLEEWKVMQFTGLLDKSGKEIYEGDILEDEEGDIFVVRYTSSARFVADLHGEKGFAYDEFALDDGHWLIIGNIYENPSLLTNN